MSTIFPPAEEIKHTLPEVQPTEKNRKKEKHVPRLHLTNDLSDLGCD